jgi:hypothetical protein
MQCRDVALKLSSGELERAPWPTRLLTRLHLLYCWRCRSYAMQVETLGAVARETLGAESVDAEGLDALQGGRRAGRWRAPALWPALSQGGLLRFGTRPRLISRGEQPKARTRAPSAPRTNSGRPGTGASWQDHLGPR